MITIQQAVTLRIARFDLLWLKALGYTFQEEPEIERCKYDAAMAEWQPQADAAAKKSGFKNWEDYRDKRIAGEIKDNPALEAIREKRPNEPCPLYDYEKSVIDQSVSITQWVEKMAEKEGVSVRDIWDRYGKRDGQYISCYDFVQNIKEAGYTGWDDGHSGNSASEAVSGAYTLSFDRHLYPYRHGALANLVGDEGYHDDRSDVHEFLKVREKK